MLVGTAEIEVIPLTTGFGARMLRELEPQTKATSARLSAVMGQEMTKGAEVNAAKIAAVQEREAVRTANIAQREAMRTSAMQERLLLQNNAVASRVGRQMGTSLETGLASGGERGAIRARESILKQLAPSREMVGLGFAVGLVAAGFEAVKFSRDFEAAMERVHTQAGASQAEVDQLRASVLALAPSVGIGPDKLADGLYHLESAGFRGAQAMDLLQAAAKGAAVGNADLEDVTQAMIAAVASGIPGVLDANDAMATINATVGIGDMRMQGLARAFATGILPSARSAGLSLQDVSAALATITDNATAPDEAATRLRMTFSLMTAPTGKAADALASIGMTSTQMAEDMRKPNGLLVAVMDLKHHLESAGLTAVQQNQVIMHAFGGGRTSGAILTLLTQSDRLQQKYEELGTSASRARDFQESWSATQKTFAQRLHEVTAEAETLGIKVGNVLVPAISATLPLVTGVIGGFEMLLPPLIAVGSAIADVAGFFEEHKTAAIILAGVLAASLAPQIALVASLEMQLIRLQVGEFFTGMAGGARGAAAALRGLASAEAVATLGITALVAGGVWLLQHFEAQQSAWDKQNDAMDAAAQHASDVSMSTIEYAKVLGLTQLQVTELARSNNIDLGGSFDDVNPKMQEAAAALRDAAQSAGGATTALDGLSAMTAVNKKGVLQLTDAQKALTKTLEGIVDPAKAWQDILGASLTTDAFSSVAKNAGTNLNALAKGLDASVTAQRNWEADLTTVTQRGGVDLADALRKMGADGVKLTHDLATGSQAQVDKVKSSLAGLAPSARQSLAEYTAVLRKQVADQAEFASNLAILALRGRTDLAREFAAMGPEAASLVGQAVHATDAQLAPLAGIFAERALLSGHAWSNGLDIITEISDEKGRASVEALAQHFQTDIPSMIGLLDEIRSHINGIPERHSIDVLLNDYASRTAAGVQNAIDNLHGKTVDVFVNLLGNPAANSTSGGLGSLLSPGLHAAGGLISGPGTGTSDSIPARLSAGEYVVNARSTSANLPLLHAINSQTYAIGGLVTRARSRDLTFDGSGTIDARTSPTTAAAAPIHYEQTVIAAPGMDPAEVAHIAARQIMWDLTDPTIPVRAGV